MWHHVICMMWQIQIFYYYRNKVWKLVHRPKDYPVIKPKWFFEKKLDKTSVVLYIKLG